VLVDCESLGNIMGDELVMISCLEGLSQSSRTHPVNLSLGNASSVDLVQQIC
jgi:hypothetical protein